jgi:hypothetical protein
VLRLIKEKCRGIQVSSVTAKRRAWLRNLFGELRGPDSAAGKMLKEQQDAC